MSGGKIREVGVIGLGIIGSRVAANLRRADFNVFVWNRTARAVPGFVASPREMAEVAPLIQIFVRDSEALLEVMEDMKPALKKHHVVCCHSTVSARAVKQAAAMASGMGAGFLDAPFTGSKQAAEKGELVYYVSGDPREMEKAGAVLQASSKKILTFGFRPGDATVLKIATNLVSGAVVGALAEALAITKGHGVEPGQLLEAFQGNANCSPLITMKLSAMMAGSFEPHFSLKNMLKDARYAQLLAKEKQLATPVLDGAAVAMAQAAVAGKGDLDYSAVFENFSGKQVEPPADAKPAPVPGVAKPIAGEPGPVGTETTRVPEEPSPAAPATAGPIKIRIAKENKWHTLKASVFDEGDWDKETA